MNTKYVEKFFRMIFVFIFVVGTVWLPTTSVGASLANEPFFAVSFPNEYVDVQGYDWPLGAQVTIIIDDQGYTDTQPVVVADWDPSMTVVNFPIEEFTLEPGQLVVMTDGVISKEHTITNVIVTDVNVDTETVTGTADSGTDVWVLFCDDGGCPEDHNVTADVNGNWETTFSDIEAGDHVIAHQFDDDSDHTAYDWRVTNPHFTVFPEWEWFDGLEWPDGSVVSISVESKPECSLERESWGGFFNGNFPEGCNIEEGDIVTFDDGTTNRWHEVRNLYITDVDTNDNTITGKADEGETVYVWPHDGWFEPLQMTVDDTGAWQVDLDDAGYTVRENSEGRSEIRDEMGNATASDWHVVHPHFTVFPEWEWFDGNDWPNGTLVNITIAGKPECETVKESWGYFFNGSFGEGCDVEIGDTVTFTDGKTIRTHTIQNLAVTKANHDDDTIKGIADPGAEVYVWPHATGEQKLATAKTKGAAKGKWGVDFNGIYDLTPGDCGRSEIRDENGNSTAVDWCISNPRIVASESGDWFWTTEFKPGDLDISIYDSPDEGANLLWSGQQVADESGFAFVGFDIHGQDLIPGNYLVISDGDSQKSLFLQPISITIFDPQYEIMAGFAHPGSDVWAATNPQN